MIYDAVVVGGGVMGTATAYSLLKRGLKRVALLERYTLGHDRAASTDRTKAIRYEYAEFKVYSLMVGRTIELWRDLEKAAGANLYNNCGVVCWGKGEQSFARRSYETLKPMGIPIEEFSPQELSRRFPQFNLADMSYATHNTEGGFLRASACVAAQASEVRRLGGELRENAEVVGIDEGPDHVVVRLRDGAEVTAYRVVLTAGAWSAGLLPRLGIELPLTANRQQVIYMGGLGSEFAPGNFPVFLDLDHGFYGFPLDEAGMLKASIHSPGPVIDPEPPFAPDPVYSRQIAGLLEQYIPPAARGDLVLERTCMYAMTPDEDFILDRLPGYRNVALGAGFSGHGFKFGPLIGELLADLALGNEPEFSLNPFSLARFASNSR